MSKFPKKNNNPLRRKPRGFSLLTNAREEISALGREPRALVRRGSSPVITQSNRVNRIIDANINRVKEGLRVCEEVARFILDSRVLTTGFKEQRHKIDAIIKSLPFSSADLLKERFSLKDVGKNIYINELKRDGYADIFFANIQRVKESLRVLEEFSKLESKNSALRFKQARYDIYEIEKKATRKISALPDSR